MMEKFDYKVTAAGRVNIIGEHIDYCGGKVMPAALSLKNAVYIRPNGTNKINLSWTTLPDKVTLEIEKLSEYKNLKYGNYQAGSAHIWQSSGHKILGCDILSDCTVPFGSGLSSSAAIEVSTIAALAAIANEKIDPVEIALAAQRAEREYAGVNCGIMDQYASACGRAGHAMLLNCATLECNYVPLELGEYSIVISDCNKPHSLIESKYNERRAETEEALRLLRKKVEIENLASLTRADFKKFGDCLDEKLHKRVEHIVGECERVNNAATAMKVGNIEFLGRLLNLSHASLKNLYEVTGNEPDALVEAAQSHSGCVGSRLTGGGFGGCTISLVKTGEVSSFKEHVFKSYKAKTGLEAKFYDSTVADGITVSKG